MIMIVHVTDKMRAVMYAVLLVTWEIWREQHNLQIGSQQGQEKIFQWTSAKKRIWQAKQELSWEEAKVGRPVDILLMLPFQDTRIWYHYLIG